MKFLRNAAAALLLAGCAGSAGYENISAEQAMNIMKSDAECVIVDVRTQEEYDEGHIRNALLIPVDEIEQGAQDLLHDREQTVLVYCRSGARASTACGKLVKMGYQHVYNFGGIIDWPYEVVR